MAGERKKGGKIVIKTVPANDKSFAEVLPSFHFQRRTFLFLAIKKGTLQINIVEKGGPFSFFFFL